MTVTATLPANTTTRRTRTRRGGLAIVAIALLAVALAGCMPDDSRTFLDRTNSLRRSKGVATLAEHDTLTQKAEAWAQHMAATGRLEHSTLSAGLGSLGWTALGENVGYSSPTSNTLLDDPQQVRELGAASGHPPRPPVHPHGGGRRARQLRPDLGGGGLRPPLARWHGRPERERGPRLGARGPRRHAVARCGDTHPDCVGAISPDPLEHKRASRPGEHVPGPSRR